MTTSLYEKLGGAKAIDSAIELFYQKITADESLKPFFQDVDMQKLSGMQKGFLTFAFGGPAEYSGASMKKAHGRLLSMGHNDEHYNAVLAHLAETLTELGISEELISEAAAIADSVRDDVLCRS